MDLQELKDLRIVVIENSEVIREGLRVAFAEANGCQVVGMATGGDEGLSLVLSEGPDVVLMNVTAPHQRGMGLLRTIRKLGRSAQNFRIDPGDPAQWSTLMKPSWIWGFLYLWSNYHLEHHYFPAVPFYNLRRFFLQIDSCPFCH